MGQYNWLGVRCRAGALKNSFAGQWPSFCALYDLIIECFVALFGVGIGYPDPSKQAQLLDNGLRAMSTDDLSCALVSNEVLL
jgi:hypothetical protein